MKVLWFSNTPAGGDEVLKIGITRAGWLHSLDKAINQKVKLSVAFYYARFAEPFEHNGVFYYPICKKNWKFNIIKKKVLGDFIERENLQVYLDIINTVKPDVIHLHGTETPFGCIIGRVEIPVAVSIQGNCTVYNHKYYSGIERVYASLRDSRIWSPYTWIFKKSFNQIYKNTAVKITKREQKTFKYCRNIIGRTDWDRRITSILAPQSKYYHNDEILRDIFYQKVWKRRNNSSLLIHSTIGESIFKGFETVCQALNELNKIGIEIEWRVAGVARDGLLDKVVRKMLKRTYPEKGLILLGNLDENELVEKMLEADIFVMPSHIENSPNSLCEAMIIGMPCITTLAGGSSSLIIDKEEGLVIQDGDPWSMAGAILELAADREKAFTYGRKARNRARLRHNKDKIVSELLVIYNLIKEQ